MGWRGRLGFCVESGVVIFSALGEFETKTKTKMKAGETNEIEYKRRALRGQEWKNREPGIP